MSPADDLCEVDSERRAAAAIDKIAGASADWRRQNRRPRALSAREALVALEFEALFVATAALNVANGVELTAGDVDRLLIAYARIDTIVCEAAA